MKYFKLNKTSYGFTLLETLIAIAMLTIVVATVTGLIQNSFIANTNAKDQVTAKYLAEEGIEYIRNLRDVNIINNGQDHWMDNIAATVGSPCGYMGSADVAGSCYVDPIYNPILSGGIPTACNGTCPIVNFDPTSGQFSYDSGSIPSKFTRTLSVVGGDGVATGDPASVYSVKIISTVTWPEGTHTLSYTANEYLFKWYTTDSGVVSAPSNPSTNIASIIVTVKNSDGTNAPNIPVQIHKVDNTQPGSDGSGTTSSAGTVEFDSSSYGFVPGEQYSVTATDPNTNSATLPQAIILQTNTPTYVTITLSAPTTPFLLVRFHYNNNDPNNPGGGYVTNCSTISSAITIFLSTTDAQNLNSNQDLCSNYVPNNIYEMEQTYGVVAGQHWRVGWDNVTDVANGGYDPNAQTVIIPQGGAAIVDMYLADPTIMPPSWDNPGVGCYRTAGYNFVPCYFAVGEIPAGSTDSNGNYNPHQGVYGCTDNLAKNEAYGGSAYVMSDPGLCIY